MWPLPFISSAAVAQNPKHRTWHEPSLRAVAYRGIQRYGHNSQRHLSRTFVHPCHVATPAVTTIWPTCHVVMVFVMDDYSCHLVMPAVTTIWPTCHVVTVFARTFDHSCHVVLLCVATNWPFMSRRNALCYDVLTMYVANKALCRDHLTIYVK